MNKLLIILLVVILIGCKESTENIIEKNIEVRGGKTSFEYLQNIYLQIKINTMGMDVPVMFYIVRPSKMRTEVNFGGNKLVTLMLPDTLISVVNNVITPLPPEARTEMKKNLESQLNYFRSELMNYQQQGGKIESHTTGQFKGKDSHKLQIRYPDGTTTYIFIDRNTYLNLGTKTEKMVEGQKLETETIYSDYRKVGNFMVPYQTEIFSGGNILASIKIDSVSINNRFDSTLFIPN